MTTDIGIADMHQDIGTAIGDPEFLTYGQTSLDQVREVGITLCATTTYWRVPEGQYQPRDEETVECYEELLRKEEKFILSREDISGLNNNLGLILVQEGFTVPEPSNLSQALEKIEVLFKAGVRILQPVYHGNKGHQEHRLGGNSSPIGTSSFDIPGIGESRGLTELGLKICENWLSKGGIIDGSHASPATLNDLVGLCKSKNRPLLISHTGTKTLVEHPRCLSDQQLELVRNELKAVGFIIGLGAGNLFLTEHKQSSGSLFRWRDAVHHLAEKVGWNHLAIGSDLGGALSGLPGEYQACETLFPALLSLLEESTTVQQYERVVGRNPKRFFKQNLPSEDSNN